MPKITPFLWFNDQAEEAAKFYVSIFKNSEMGPVTRYGEGGMGKPGSVMTVSFKLEGLEFTALNGGPQYKFTPAISFVVPCRTQEEIDHFWAKLSEGGEEMMCGWVQDRYGVTWQVVPANIGELLNGPEAMKAMLSMKKLDMKRLEEAARKS
jgi:predicted 3-demethylubiquinone-9 3-methyltransferase (glyoxalase superfamily)